MVKVKTVSVIYERKFNLGDYNSVHIGVTYWADLDDEEPQPVVEHLQMLARDDVKREHGRLREKRPNA